MSQGGFGSNGGTRYKLGTDSVSFGGGRWPGFRVSTQARLGHGLSFIQAFKFGLWAGPENRIWPTRTWVRWAGISKFGPRKALGPNLVAMGSGLALDTTGTNMSRASHGTIPAAHDTHPMYGASSSTVPPIPPACHAYDFTWQARAPSAAHPGRACCLFF